MNVSHTFENIYFNCVNSSSHLTQHNFWFSRAEPKKKKKVDPRREQMLRERLKKKLKKLEKVPPELIPIEDYITPAKSLDETR